MNRPATIPRRTRRGVIMVVAMVIVFALASMALVLGSYVRTEATAAANQLAAQEAGAIARGAEQYVLSLLTEQLNQVPFLDERAFAAVPVGNGYFWILRPDYGDALMPAYGLTDESGKLHLNTAGVERLTRLPGVSEDLAAAIIGWRSDEENVLGTHYMSQREPYREKGGAFEMVEELLLLRGVDRQLLYGMGTSLPLGSSSGARPFASEQYQIRGLFDYFTVWSVLPNSSADRQRRVNINNRSNPQRNRLRQVLLRQLGDERTEAIMAQLGNQNYLCIFDFAMQVQLEPGELEQIEDYITTVNSRRVRGRININTAPREVLLTLETLSADDVDTLMSHRPAAVANNPRSIAWVLDVLAERALGLGNQITGQGRQFSADIVAVSGNGRAFQRVRIVVDAAPSTPRIVYRRDLTDLGWPMDPSIREQLRAGGTATGF